MDTMSGRVLVVDDDRAIRESLARALELDGYEVELASDGAVALAAIRERRPDVAVLDVMMPNIDGLTVCRVLRAERDRLPILMLTARTETPDRVAGLDAGADDYLPKPFELDELLARLRAVRRRQEGRGSPLLQVADLTLDPATREVKRGGRPVRGANRFRNAVAVRQQRGILGPLGECHRPGAGGEHRQQQGHQSQQAAPDDGRQMRHQYACTATTWTTALIASRTTKGRCATCHSANSRSNRL